MSQVIGAVRLLFTVLSLQVASATVVLPPLPDLPSDGIYDPGDWLTKDAHATMARDLAGAREKWGTRVFVVILADKPDSGNDIFVSQVRCEWGEKSLWGLIYHVIGDPESPRFFGENSRPVSWSQEQADGFQDSVAAAVTEVRRRAKTDSDARLQILNGTRDMVDELGYLGVVMGRIDKTYDKARGDGLQAFRSKASRWEILKKLIMVAVPLVLLLLAVLICFVVKARKGRKVNFLFPETSPRTRFLAPWSGGGNAFIQFASRINEDGSRKG